MCRHSVYGLEGALLLPEFSIGEFSVSERWRSLAILCAVSGVLWGVLWAVDQWRGLPFRLGWLLVSSVFWGFVFWGLSRRRKKL